MVTILTKHSSGSVEDGVACNHWDLGSIPRSPQMFIHVFSNSITCSLPNNQHHMPSCINVPCVQSHRSEGQGMKEHHAHESTHLQAVSKVKQGWLLDGLRLPIHPQFWPNTPMVLFYFLLFSFPFLFSFN